MIKKIINFITGRSDIWIDRRLYMLRWKFLPDWLPGFRIHKILISDDGPELHDHPFSFITFILKGGYYEHLEDGTRTYHGAGSVLIRPAKTMHRIELQRDCSVPGGHNQCDGDELPAWTFVIRTRYFRDWGFLTDEGWVKSTNFLRWKRSNEIPGNTPVNM